MSIQNMNTAAGRNSFRAAAINPNIKVPAGKKSIAMVDTKPVGKKPGSPVKGFSGGGLIKAKV